MKKIIVSVIISFMALFICFKFNASAYQLEYEYPTGYNKISETDSFTATEIKCIPIEDIDKTELRTSIKDNYFKSFPFKGYIERKRRVEGTDIMLTSIIDISEDSMIYKLYYNGVLYVDLYYVLDGTRYYQLCNPIIFSDPTDPNYSVNYKVRFLKPDDDVSNNTLFGKFNFEIEQFLIYSNYEIKESNTIEDKLNFVPSPDEILSNTELMLDSGVILNDGSLLYSNYLEKKEGNYYMIIGFIDENNIYVISYNIIIKKPILSTPDIYVSLNKKLTDNDIRSQINKTGLKNYSYDADEYFESYSVPGRYNVFVSYSIDDKIYSYKFRIIVIEAGDYEIEINNKDILKHEYYNDFDIEDLKSRLILNQILPDTIEIDISKYENNKTIAGIYPIYIKGYDDLGNLYIQSYMLNVFDNVEPIVSLPDDLIYSYSYTSPIDLDYYKYNFIVDDVSDYEIFYDPIENLQEGPKICDFEVNYRIVDIYSNETIYPVKIKIIDDVAPKIICSNINILSNQKLDLIDLKRNVSAYDEIDGDIPLDNIIVDDANSYLSNYNKKGTYKIKVMAKDNSNNYSHAEYNIIVSNKNNDNKTIIISSKYKYTKEELILYLKNQNMLDNDVNYSISSDYFDDEVYKKIYDLKIEDENGEIINYKLELNDVNAIIEDNTNKEKKDYTIIIVISAISGALIITIAVLIIIIYKKRH